MLALTTPLRALDAAAATVVSSDPRLRQACASQGLLVVPLKPYA